MNDTRTTRLDYEALRSHAPYIVAWSGELELPVDIVARRSGVGYRDEIPEDRDAHGVLWWRAASRPGRGEPEFGRVHSLRQRKAMRRLLCHVCGGPCDRTADGYLWLLPDYRTDWHNWPHNRPLTEPPVCRPCARRATALCPSLRARGTAVLRVTDAPVTGVYGGLYGPTGNMFGTARLVQAVTVNYTDHRIRWIRAHQLVRTIHQCTLITPEELRETQ